jgi:3-(3-hydroxy-phenyl)propionate hydroxylase
VDDESMRVLQAAGLAHLLLPELFSADTGRVVDDRGRTLLEINTGRPLYGFAPSYTFHQPSFETTLRNGVSQSQSVQIHLGWQLEGVTQASDGVHAVVRERASGRRAQLRAQYLFGCDGGRSTVRDAIGVKLRDLGFEQRWLVVDVAEREQPASMPPPRQVLSRRRPTTIVPITPGRRRWEFMVLPGETPCDILQREATAALLSRWIDPARVEITRAALYTHHTLIAERWRDGRILLLGDAAHQMPPFAGAGMCSGIRDAANVCWKIAAVLRGKAAPQLLDTYEVERAPQVERVMRTAMVIGRLMGLRFTLFARVRDLALRMLNASPFKHRYRGLVSPRLAQGLLDRPPRLAALRSPVGELFIQPRVDRAGAQANGQTLLLDDALGPGFSVVGFGLDPRQAMSEADARFLAETLGASFVRVWPRGAAPDGSRAHPLRSGIELQEVIDVDGELAAWFLRHRGPIAVVRPDRYVFGLYRTDEAHRAAHALLRMRAMNEDRKEN